MLGQLQIRQHLWQGQWNSLLVRRRWISECMCPSHVPIFHLPSQLHCWWVLGGAPMSLLSMPDYSIRLRSSPNSHNMHWVWDGYTRSLASSHSSPRSTQARNPKHWLCLRSCFRIGSPLSGSSLRQCVGICQCPPDTQCRTPFCSHARLANITTNGYFCFFKRCKREKHQPGSPVSKGFLGCPNGRNPSDPRRLKSTYESVKPGHQVLRSM